MSIAVALGVAGSVPGRSKVWTTGVASSEMLGEIGLCGPVGVLGRVVSEESGVAEGNSAGAVGAGIASSRGKNSARARSSWGMFSDSRI